MLQSSWEAIYKKQAITWAGISLSRIRKCSIASASFAISMSVISLERS
ncbi:hypothetical protein EW14_0761 [Prochlorococcus sp. MIT 0604]|nr:hypothetical protein EW14_0761 [Prochlorococcus sp. MIT 0604]